MTRTREVEPGSGKMPDYKSPSNRLVHSLRQGYDNTRKKLADARKQIKGYQIKTRDLALSRAQHKENAKTISARVEMLEKENMRLRSELELSSEKKTR